MSNSYRVLVINPLLYTTRIAVFENEQNLYEEELPLSLHDVNLDIYEQVHIRRDAIFQAFREIGLNISSVDAVCGRGGLLQPISGGTYVVTEKMIEDLFQSINGKHVSNLGAILANEIASNLNIDAYIVDPVVVDEMTTIAKRTGIPTIQRKSIFHALNQKSVAREIAELSNSNYDEMNLIVAHMGGGVTIGAHANGKVVDVNNGFDGEGPFSLERAGSIPNNELINLSYQHHDQNMLKEMIIHQGGIYAYLGTNKARDVKDLVEANDNKAILVIETLAYQVAKEIGKMAVVLEGNVDKIVLTGDLAEIHYLNQKIMNRVSWIADVHEYPGENVMLALSRGALRVLEGTEIPKEYEKEIKDDGEWQKNMIWSY
ncbi:butyrate kinase [Gracilibacillus dipsosauri]|uniref:butyrate kinase n=1 Tax=Gracilibacillus dipsosauri TaxID=178340 RepID=UPI002409880E